MGTLFGFAVGYVLGARLGSQHFDDVVEAVRAIRSSTEFRAFVDALGRHVRGTAASVGEWLTAAETSSVDELLARARHRAGAD